MSEDLEQLKQRLPLLEYLQRHDWTGFHIQLTYNVVGETPKGA